MTSDLPPTSTDAPPTPSGPRTLQDFFAWIRGQGIYRPDDNRWIAGVATGLARRWNIDPILVRGIFVALTFAGGLGVAAYGIAWLLLPQTDGTIHLQQAIRGHFSAGFAGAVLCSLALIGDPGNDGMFSGPPRFLGWIALIALIWWILRHRHDEARYGWSHWNGGPGSGTTAGAGDDAELPEYGSPPANRTAASSFSATAPPVTGVRTDGQAPWAPPPWTAPGYTPPRRTPDPSRRSRRITRSTLGVALLVAAAVLLAGGRFDTFDAPAGLVAAAAALGVIALGTITAGLSGRRAGGLAPIGLLLMAGLLIATGVHQAGVRSGQNFALAGEYTWRPISPAAAAQQYNLGLGQAELVLTDPRLVTPAGPPVRVNVRVGAGQLTVVTPESVPATIDIELGAGQITGPGGTTQDVDSSSSDHTVSRRTGPAGAPRLIVTVQQGAGEVILRPAPAGTAAVTPSPSPSIPTQKLPAGSTPKESSRA